MAKTIARIPGLMGMGREREARTISLIASVAKQFLPARGLTLVQKEGREVVLQVRKVSQYYVPRQKR